MENKEVIEKTIAKVKETLKEDFSGHDWLHGHRVWKTASKIAEKESSPIFLL